MLLGRVYVFFIRYIYEPFIAADKYKGASNYKIIFAQYLRCIEQKQASKVSFFLVELSKHYNLANWN